MPDVCDSAVGEQVNKEVVLIRARASGDVSLSRAYRNNSPCSPVHGRCPSDNCAIHGCTARTCTCNPCDCPACDERRRRAGRPLPDLRTVAPDRQLTLDVGEVSRTRGRTPERDGRIGTGPVRAPERRGDEAPPLAALRERDRRLGERWEDE
jgi:hypothetical protein